VSYLGYDRGRLVALRRRLGELADETAGLRFPDPLAADAARRYHDAATSLTDWRAELATIDACAFSSPFRPVALDPADPALVDLLHPGDAAWATVTDPRAATAVALDPAVHARHVAEYLAAVDLSQVLGDDGRAGDLARLIGSATADAASRAALLAALGPARFAAIAEDLAARVARDGASGETTTQAGRAGTVLGLLAAAVGPGTPDLGAWEAQLAERTDPYATALVLRAAHLAGADLGRLAAATWRRWRERAGDGIDEAAAATEQAPAILLATLAADALAARRALETFDDDDLALLFGPDIDTSGVLSALLASADPRVGPPDDVERSMVNVLGFLVHHQDLAGASRVTDGLGAYAGPYLEHLLGACDLAAYPARRWDLRGAAPTALLGWIARSPVAAASLESYLDAIVITRFTALAADPAPDDALLHHLGAIAGAVDAMVADGRVLRAEQRNAIWQGTLDGLGSVATNIVTSWLPDGGIAVSRPIGLSLEAGLTLLLGSGPPGVGADVPAVVAAEGDRIEERRGRREAAYLAAVFGAARSAGTMPASAAPPPYDPDESYLTTRNRWLAAARPGDAAARQRLWDVAESFDAGMSGALLRYPPGDAC
jgi:hypothetical protein